MNKQDLIKKSQELENNLLDIVSNNYNRKDFWKNYKELQNTNIEINKLNNIYYNGEIWFTKLLDGLNFGNITGQALNKKFIEWANNLQGVYAIEDESGSGCKVMIITPYSVYRYGFARGYCGVIGSYGCNKEKVTDTTQKMNGITFINMVKN